MPKGELDAIFDWYKFTRDLLQWISKMLEQNPENLHDRPWPKELKWQPIDKVQDKLKHALEELDDLVVLALFAEFETWLLQEISEVLCAKGEPVTAFSQGVLEHARSALERESLAKLLDVYKTIVPPETVDQVKEIKKYRNWVAHGKRKDQPFAMTPKEAYERLNEFITQTQKAKGA
jgi:hypothetical protein